METDNNYVVWREESMERGEDMGDDRKRKRGNTGGRDSGGNEIFPFASPRSFTHLSNILAARAIAAIVATNLVLKFPAFLGVGSRKCGNMLLFLFVEVM